MYVVISHICPGEDVPKQLLWCKDQFEICAPFAAGLPDGIVSALTELFKKFLDENFITSPCPNWLVFPDGGAQTFQGYPGKIMAFKGCLGCEKAGAYVGITDCGKGEFTDFETFTSGEWYDAEVYE